MSRIRCIHVITRLILGGAQENTLLTVEGLDRIEGYRTTLVTGPALGPEGSLIERARRNRVDLAILPSLRRAISPWRDPLALRTLTRLFKKERPHIVHTHSSKAGVLGRMAARRAGVPVIVHTIHGPPFHPYQGGETRQLGVPDGGEVRCELHSSLHLRGGRDERTVRRSRHRSARALRHDP